MGDKKPMDFTVVEMAEIECTDEPAEFSCEISLPPRALTKLFGWKWYFKWHFNRVLNKIRKLITKAKIKRAYRRCYNRMKNAGIAVFGMCAGLFYENGLEGASDLCSTCPYYRNVNKEK